MSRIFIVGSGAGGSATGRALLRLGHRVSFVDADPARVAALTAEGLDARRLISLDGEPEAFILLCLPAPIDAEGCHLGALENGAVQLGLALAQVEARHTVVLRCAVPPGTTETVIRPLIESCADKREGLDFSLAVSPEGLPGITVVGARSRPVAERVGDLLGSLGAPGHRVRLFDDPATAELITGPVRSFGWAGSASSSRTQTHYRSSRPPRRTNSPTGEAHPLRRIPRQFSR